MEPRISRITLGVADLARATRFYEDFPMFEMIPHSPFIVQTAR
jgi:catechol 2,3-dioxygenase-like lactoylglutathione lyase family enzyme